MASNNIARLGVVLGLDMAEFTASIDKAILANRKLGNELKKDMNRATGDLADLVRATEDYGKTLTKVELMQRAINEGKYGTQNDAKLKETHALLLQQAAAYDAVEAAAKKAGKAQSGLTGFQQQNLMYQTTDFVTQVASGQNVLIAALQQGGQLKDVMGGLRPMFNVLGGLIFSTTGALVGLGAAFGTVAYAAYLGHEEIDKLNKSILLTGNYSQVSANDFEGMARVISSSSKASVGEAKDILNAMISSGQFTKQTFNSVATVIEKYAELSGEAQKAAAEKLIPSLDGSASSAAKLNSQFHFLTLEQYKNIEVLEKNGKKQEAIIEVSDALNASLNRQKVNVGLLGQAYEATGKFLSGFWETLKGIGKEQTGAERIIELQVQINKLATTANYKSKSLMPWERGGQNTQDKEIDRLTAIKDRLVAGIVAEQARSDKIVEESKKIDDYAAAGGLSKQEQIQKQTDDALRAARLSSAMLTNNAILKLDADLASAQEKIEADYLENIKGKNAVFAEDYRKKANAETLKTIAEHNLQLKELLKQGKTLEDNAAKAKRQADHIALMSSLDEEHKITEQASFNLIELREQYNKDILEKDAAFVKERTDLFNAEEEKEIANYELKLEEFRDKQRIKNIDAAIKEREDRQKITDEENKLRFERIMADVAFYYKAEETAAIEKDKLKNQIAMVGFREKEVKLAEIELQYQRELKRLESSGLYDPDSLEAMKKKAAAKKADLSLNIEIANQLKETQRINDTVWNNMNNALDNFVESGILSFHDLAGSIIKDLMKIELKASAMNLWRALSGGNGLTGLMAMMSTGAFLGAPITGMTQSQFQMPEFADGGSPPVGMPSLVGERGPEIFVPKTAGTIIPNNQLGSMGGTTNVTNYNINAIDTKSFEDRILGSSKAVWAANAYGAKNISVGRGRT